MVGQFSTTCCFVAQLSNGERKKERETYRQRKKEVCSLFLFFLHCHSISRLSPCSLSLSLSTSHARTHTHTLSLSSPCCKQGHGFGGLVRNAHGIVSFQLTPFRQKAVQGFLTRVCSPPLSALCNPRCAHATIGPFSERDRDRETDRQTERQRGETDRQTDREGPGQADTHTHTHTRARTHTHTHTGCCQRRQGGCGCASCHDPRPSHWCSHLQGATVVLCFASSFSFSFSPPPSSAQPQHTHTFSIVFASLRIHYSWLVSFHQWGKDQFAANQRKDPKEFENDN